ncbi:DUF2971 domain-containing protein [Demequina sp. SO4-13]|uniref:DUF2971 domain-containing protein n=1 Tax=Demequina sp. SO4-13 TaxID=3401027 RepID=UPI003AF6C567
MTDDSLEIVYALRQIRRFALDEEPGLLSATTRDLIANALEVPNPSEQQRSVFVLSACADGASDYLWDKYAGPTGVAIEIATTPRVLLRRALAEPEPLTGWYPVAYTDDHQRTLVRDLADTLERNINYGERYPTHPVWSRYVGLSGRDVASLISPLVSTMKHPDFLSEREYRYVDRPGIGDAIETNAATGRDFTRIKPTDRGLPILKVALGRDCGERHYAEMRSLLRRKDQSASIARQTR